MSNNPDPAAPVSQRTTRHQPEKPNKLRLFLWPLLVLVLLAGSWLLIISLLNANSRSIIEDAELLRDQRIAECEAVDATFSGSLQHGHCALDDGTLIDPRIAKTRLAP